MSDRKKLKISQSEKVERQADDQPQYFLHQL
jgi:hypothetical protein